jgi:hypothetical protein
MDSGLYLGTFHCTAHGGGGHWNDAFEIRLSGGGVEGRCVDGSALSGSFDGSRFAARLARLNGSIEEWEAGADETSLWGLWRDIKPQDDDPRLHSGHFRLWRQDGAPPSGLTLGRVEEPREPREVVA